MPEMAAALRAGWQTACEVRSRLRQLGATAEELALKLTPTWRLAMEELPHAVHAVTLPPHRSDR